MTVSRAARIAADLLPEALEPIVRRRVRGAGRAVIENWRPAAQGYSTETYLFDLVGVDDGDDDSVGLVFRRPPERPVLPDFDLRRQYLTMDRLRATDVPVPTMRWIDAPGTDLGTPYFVMDRIDDAVTVSDVPPYHQAGIFADADAAGRAELWSGCVDVIASLRAVDPAARRLGFLDLRAFGSSAPQRLAGFLRYAIEWASGSTAPRKEFIDALDWLDGHLYEPEHVGLCWGDSRMSNVLYNNEFDVVAALDWEIAYLGDPAGDLAWMLTTDWISSPFPDHAPAPGTPSTEETLDRYRRRTGLRLDHMRFAHVAAGLLLAVPLLRLNEILDLGDVDLAEICIERLDHVFGDRLV
ncbi:phosphotransferase family protein [Gordonia sp. SL306]|uniref:phosphotransferase family protein n=1 Tax=Gordonia sp. SL306 TaxID=2995145 RepID=UPI002271C083|nr:phosphotransferase family protein [Gordonia sp. SL306]WAC54592.1 phosphotransferase family protein [Gordonia sp. SL306]